MVTDEERKEAIEAGLKLKELRVPKEVIFPDRVQFVYKGKTEELKSVTKYLEKNFIVWLEKLQAMPTTEQERKARQTALTKFIKKQNEIFAKVCTPENYILNIADGKRYINDWNDYPLDMVENCRLESINNLELIISKISPARNELISLYQKYIDKIKNSVLTPTLKAGNYNHKEIYQKLVDDKIITEGNFNSWNSYFVGTDFSDRKKITIDTKRKTEFLYFIKLYCPEFDNGETRKIKELKEIVTLSDGSQYDSNVKETQKATKKEKIESFLY